MPRSIVSQGSSPPWREFIDLTALLQWLAYHGNPALLMEQASAGFYFWSKGQDSFSQQIVKASAGEWPALAERLLTQQASNRLEKDASPRSRRKGKRRR